MRAKTDLRSAQQRTVTALYEGVWLGPGPTTGTGAVLPMGGGKTASALTAFEELQRDGYARDMFVLAPKRVAQLVWRAEVRQWAHLQRLKVVFVGGSAAQRAQLLREPADVYCVGIDNAKWFVDWAKTQKPARFSKSVFCVDEMSRFKNPRGKRLRALAPIIPWFLARWGLTGTPRPNGFEDLFGQLKLLTAGQLWGNSFDKWRQENFYPLDYNAYKWALLPERREKIIADTNRVMFTIGPDDMPDLPALNDGPEFIEWVDMPDEIVERYKMMMKELVAWLSDDKRSGVAAANMAVASGKLCQLVQGFLYTTGEHDFDFDFAPGQFRTSAYSPTAREKRGIHRFHDVKMERLLEMVEEAGGEPVMVAYEFQADLDSLKENFPGLRWLGAGVNDRDAELFERAWNNGDLDVAAVHPASAGHGLNLQFGGAQLFHYGFNWSAELYDQLLKRFHRPGQHRPVWSRPILMRAPGLLTTDEMKYQRVHDKMADQELFRRLLKEV